MENERPHARIRVDIEHTRDDDEVVAGLALSLELAIEPSGGIVERGAAQPTVKRHIGEAVGAPLGELTTQLLVVPGENVDAEATRVAQFRPGLRRLSGAEQDQRWVERD